MEGGQIVFRVHGDGAAMDWTVQPDAVTFRDVLVSSILHPRYSQNLIYNDTNLIK